MMFKKLKLVPEHKTLIEGLGKELKQDRNGVLYDVIEMGFVMLRLATEDDEKIKQAYDHCKTDEAFMKKAKLMREWWEAGKEQTS